MNSHASLASFSNVTVSEETTALTKWRRIEEGMTRILGAHASWPMVISLTLGPNRVHGELAYLLGDVFPPLRTAFALDWKLKSAWFPLIAFLGSLIVAVSVLGVVHGVPLTIVFGPLFVSMVGKTAILGVLYMTMRTIPFLGSAVIWTTSVSLALGIGQCFASHM